MGDEPAREREARSTSRLVVAGVWQGYGRQNVLKDITFELGDGVTGLLGPNGSGKSTLMRCVAGVIAWRRGTITVDGIDAARHPLAARRRVGYLPERAGLPPELRVTGLLRIAAAAKGLPRAEQRAAVDRVMVDTKLAGYGHRVIGNLSKGFRQRVVLAQALLGEPGLLVLDEPTSGIDAETLEDLYRLVTVYGQSHAVLLSTHLAADIAAMCDRSLVITAGQLAEHSPLAPDDQEVPRLRRAIP